MSEMTVWKANDFRRILSEMRPQIGNYEWMWRLLRIRSRKTQGFLPYKLHKILCRFVRKPYFIGQTKDGISYCGNVRDAYPAICATFPGTETELTQFVLEEMKGRGGDYLDVGTNIGVVAATIARDLKGTARVLAFEPMPETARCAAVTFALNHLDNVSLFPCAIGNGDGEISFYVPPGHSESASIHRRDNMPEWQETRVPSHKLDTLLAAGYIDRVGFLKFDVEGHEPQAVAGAQRLIARDRPLVLYEYHPDIAPGLGWAAQDVAHQIESFGDYSFQTLREDGSLTDFPPVTRTVVNVAALPVG